MAKRISLEERIERYVRKQFPDGLIDGVRIERGYSADGDEIVNVAVIFGRPPQTIGIGSMTRSLWAELTSHDLDLFPIFSFRTSEEDALLREAA